MWGREVIRKEEEGMFQARSPSLKGRTGSLLLLGDGGHVTDYLFRISGRSGLTS